MYSENIYILTLLIGKILMDPVDDYDSGRTGELIRKKRWLLFPSGTNVVQLIVGIGVPVEVTPEAVVFGWAFRAFYTMPNNVSELTLMDYGASSKKRSISRWDLYKVLEHDSERRGFGGRSCLLRSICEASETPLDRYNGLFEELIHTIFTPSTTAESISDHTDNEYFAAQVLGHKNKGNCKYLFPGCKMSFMEVFTYLPTDFM